MRYGSRDDAKTNNQDIAMNNRKLRVGQAISPEEFEELSEEELARLVPRQYRDYFPGKDACGDGFFYLFLLRAFWNQADGRRCVPAHRRQQRWT